MTHRNLFLSIVTTALTVLAPSPSAAQLTEVTVASPGPVPSAGVPRPRYAGGVVAGASQFDLSGTGTTGIIGGRIEADVRSWLVAEGAVGFFRPAEQFGGRSRYTIPEAQLQVQIPGHMVRPYLGAGGGWVFASGRNMTGTVSGAGGLRVELQRALDARGELRVRGIGSSFSGATAEWTLGLGYRF